MMQCGMKIKEEIAMLRMPNSFSTPKKEFHNQWCCNKMKIGIWLFFIVVFLSSPNGPKSDCLSLHRRG